MTEHGYTWKDVRSELAITVGVGEMFINPATGTSYREYSGGVVMGASAVPGALPMPLDGTVWTVTANDGSSMTARNGAGEEITQAIPIGQRVLWVTNYTPSVGDHVFVTRARAPLVAGKITSILHNGKVNVRIGRNQYLSNVLPEYITEHPLYRREPHELNTD